jgi:hypothetical protein
VDFDEEFVHFHSFLAFAFAYPTSGVVVTSGFDPNNWFFNIWICRARTTGLGIAPRMAQMNLRL